MYVILCTIKSFYFFKLYYVNHIITHTQHIDSHNTQKCSSRKEDVLLFLSVYPSGAAQCVGISSVSQSITVGQQDESSCAETLQPQINDSHWYPYEGAIIII